MLSVCFLLAIGRGVMWTLNKVSGLPERTFENISLLGVLQECRSGTPGSSYQHFSSSRYPFMESHYSSLSTDKNHHLKDVPQKSAITFSTAEPSSV